MDEAAGARIAARDAVADIAPPHLHDLIDRRLESAAMTPGVLTRLSARAAEKQVDPEELDRRSAGVQLIYDGLQLTRRLARTAPWTKEGDTEADIEILAADVLVARGFFLLARTEAAALAVETVRAFGRDETDRANGRRMESAEHALEADVFELAIVAGISAAGLDRPDGIRSFAVELANSFEDRLPEAPELLSDATIDILASLVVDSDRGGAPSGRIGARSSVHDS